MTRTVVSHDSSLNVLENDKGCIPHTITVQKKRERGGEGERALELHSRAAHPVRDAVKIQTQHR